MKLVGLMSTAVLSLTLVVAAPVYAQEQHEQPEEKKDQPAEQKEKKTQPAKPDEKAAPQQHKDAKQPEKTTQQQKKAPLPQDKSAKQAGQTARPQPQHTTQAKSVQQAQHGAAGRIPDDRFKAHFGQEHTFHVTQANYSSHRFQYGGYSFGFVDAWPSNWLYTQDVYVIDIDGVYYLCNAMYPGVNLALVVTV
jgi:cytoskeletal protein RodZ